MLVQKVRKLQNLCVVYIYYLVVQVEVLLSQFEWKSRDSTTETRLTDHYRSTDSLSFVTTANFPCTVTARRTANDVTYTMYTALPIHYVWLTITYTSQPDVTNSNFCSNTPTPLNHLLPSLPPSSLLPPPSLLFPDRPQLTPLLFSVSGVPDTLRAQQLTVEQFGQLCAAYQQLSHSETNTMSCSTPV